jgi:hypothetical protein
VFDFAIVPLGGAEDPDLARFNSGKSIIKFIEYGGGMIPGIFSNVPPYSEHLRHNIDSLLVQNERNSWLKAMFLLYNDDNMRYAMANAAYARVRQAHDISYAAKAFLNISSIASGGNEISVSKGCSK